jgi:hypothetical protein
MSSKRIAALLPAAAGLLLAPGNVARAAESIFPDTVSPAARASDAPSWELGTIFRATQAGSITHVRVFSLADEFGDHEARIWRNADGALVAGPITWTFGGEEFWIDLDIPDVPIEPGDDYTVSISTTPDGWYPANGGYFSDPGGNGQFLEFPAGAGVFSDTLGTRPTNSFNNAAYLRDIVFEPDLSGTVMRVQAYGIEIDDGDISPELPDGTEIGGKALNAGAREQTFTILNLGQTALELNGNPRVAIEGPNADDFVVGSQPEATVAGGGSTTFVIRFDPSAIGTREATVRIPHADSPGNPYDFAIRGTGLGGGAGVLGNDSEGAFARNIDDTQIHGNRFQSPVDMRITELRAKVLELQGTFKCAVYSDTQGAADRLLAQSVEVVNATNGWNTFTLTSPLDLVAGDSYWLVIWADTPGARVQADPVGGAWQAFYSYLDMGGLWPDPIALITPVAEGPRTYCIYAEGTPIGTAPGPELDVRGQGKLIVAGDLTPSGLDGTDFGNLNVATGSQERTFTLENRGDAPLELSGAPPVEVTGPHAADFTVTPPAETTLAPGASTTFTVKFDPSVRGLRTATLGIASNDLSEDPYAIALQGAGFITGRESIWPDSKTGSDIAFDGTYYELGMIFRTGVPGTITHLRVYSLASESGDHTARLWRNDAEEVIGGPYTWNYGGFTGWITLDIPDVEIEPDIEYTVSVSTGTSPNRNYPNVAADLLAEGGNGLNLSYPVNAGVFTTLPEGRPMESFNGGNYLRDIVFLPAGATVDLPDIDLVGNNNPITDGDVSPDPADGTDFGEAALGASVERSFAIRNAGTAPLNLGATPPVAITGPEAADFSVISAPEALIPPGGETVFRVRFTPAAQGVRNASVSIENDGDENPFDFAISGTGTAGGGSLRITGITADPAAGSVTLRWEGEGSQFQVEKSGTITGPFQPLGAAQAGREYTDAGALAAGTQSFYRIRSLP